VAIPHKIETHLVSTRTGQFIGKSVLYHTGPVVLMALSNSVLNYYFVIQAFLKVVNNNYLGVCM